MCGIAGVVSTGAGDQRASAMQMVGALEHRGPDDRGLWSDGLCALGHTRLAIIDPSASGSQPLANEDGTVLITFNGEIYNFQVLRRELESLGHRFRSRTDTEVVVHAYEQWAESCVRKLRGMFAFGIWDQPRRRLFLARDRIGKKPLFYTQSGTRFVFASELQALLAVPGVEREVDLQAIDAYLSWGYVPSPRTAFRAVHKLPPAHCLTLEVTETGFEKRIERYWELEYEPKLQLTESEAAEALREKLGEAVRLRMVSDVPLGAFLSGGIDSSIIVGLMSQASGNRVKTFSIGFDETGFSELEHAGRVARRWNTEHHEFVVRPDAIEILPALIRHFGEPFADEAALPTFYLSQMTRTGVTVALNGDGGDESFAGYGRYFSNRVADALSRVPGSGAAASLLDGVDQEIDLGGRFHRAVRFLKAAAGPTEGRYRSWVGYLQDLQRSDLYTNEFAAVLRGSDSDEWLGRLFEGAGELDPADSMMRADVRSYLPDDLLVKVDITSMASSLEARSPFLDHEVMEFAARLPARLKLKRRESKYLLKKAYADLLPPETIRRKKMGFNVPVGEWFRGTMKEFLNDLLLSPRGLSRGYFKPEAIRRLCDSHLEHREDHGRQLWSLLVLEVWHREILDAGVSMPGKTRVPLEVASGV